MTVASLCYTLEVWLISNTTGETISMGTNFPFWVSTDVTTGEQIGIFGYDGLAQGFPVPEGFRVLRQHPPGIDVLGDVQEHRSSVHVLDGTPR